jgi:hypothetical protein
LERLIAGSEIHDGEAAGADAGAFVADDALAVGSAMLQRGGHSGEAVGMAQGSAGAGYGAEDAAHGPYAA